MNDRSDPEAVDDSAISAVFALDAAGPDVWIARNSDPRGGRMFGGTTIAKLLAAAHASTSGALHTSSLAVNFIRPADGAIPCEFQVDRVHDGKSSATRRITVAQNATPVAIGTVSFHTPRDTWSHGFRGVAPDAPDDLPQTGLPHPARAIPPDALDIRYVDEHVDGTFVRKLWFRALELLPDDTAVHECILAFVSDLYLFEPIVAEHGFSGADRSIRYGTTHHAMWFHHRPRADDWMVITSRSPVGAGGRGLVTAEVCTADGRVVGTVVQEVAIRLPVDLSSDHHHGRS